MRLFIASEVMLFGGLFAASAILRAGDPEWHHFAGTLSTSRGVINTAWLAMATILLRAAVRAAAHDNIERAQRGLRLSAAGALMFLVAKATEYSTLAAAGMYPSSNTFFGVYYLLTGAHGLHVLGGGLATAYFAVRGPRSTGGQAPRFVDRLRPLSLYWTFIDIVWLVILVTLYLL